MDLSKGIKKLFTRSKAVDLNEVLAQERGWHDVAGAQSGLRVNHDDYENGYASITKIVNGFAKIEPYFIDDKAKPYKGKHPILDALYSPNKRMSAYEFRQACMLMSLVHDKWFLQVLHKGGLTSNGYINPTTVTGFRFLEFVQPYYDGNKWNFPMKDGNLTEDEVLMFGDINPYNTSYGYSPAHAARRWTKLDDYIAEYQTGFFRNGAVPAGQFIITAKTSNQFMDIKKTMQMRHQGAENNNNVTYTWKPTDEEGKAQNATIEWVPFNTNNKDLALKDLLEVVNNKVDSSFGVPAEIRGVVSNSNYASVSVARQVFIEYTLEPATLKLWDKFTHELARVTGGFGYAITFDLPVPEIAEESVAKAEAKKTEVETISALAAEGYTFQSAVIAIKSGDYTKLVAVKKDVASSVAPQPTNGTQPTQDNPDVQNSGEAKNEPDAQAKSKQISETDRQTYERRLETTIRGQINRQVEEAANNVASKAVADPTDTNDKLFTEEMISVLLPLIQQYGVSEQAVGIALVVEGGLKTGNITPYTLTPEQRAAYEEYLLKVAGGFNAETSNLIRQTLADGIEQNLATSQIQNNLRSLIEDDYRVSRLAISEVNRAKNRASVTAIQNISAETGYKIVKQWVHLGGGDTPCEFCRAMIGTEVEVDQSFLPVGADVTGEDGGVYTNNFVSAETADLHPHDHCTQIYKLVKS